MPLSLSVYSRCCIRICSAMVGVPQCPLLPSLPTALQRHAPRRQAQRLEPPPCDSSRPPASTCFFVGEDFGGRWFGRTPLRMAAAVRDAGRWTGSL